jgi:hypothetical protein
MPCGVSFVLVIFIIISKLVILYYFGTPPLRISFVAPPNCAIEYDREH